MKAFAEHTGQRQPCPANGMRASDLACGLGEDIVRNNVEKCRGLIFVEIQVAGEAGRKDIMEDYELGVAHLLYVTTLKLGVYQQLPILMTGTANKNLELARKATSNVIHQYQVIKAKENLHVRIRALLEDGSEYLAEAVLFIDGAPLSDLKVVAGWRAAFSMCKVNEISVEALHKIGASESSHATRVSPVYVVSILRTPEYFAGIVGDMQGLAEACSEVRTPNKQVKQFSLENHSLIQRLRDEAVVAGKMPHLAITHQAIRSIIYRYDLESMFTNLDPLRKAIDKANDQRKARQQLAVGSPLIEAQKATATDDEKIVAAKTTYKMTHFKESQPSLRICLQVSFYINLLHQEHAPEDHFFTLPKNKIGELDSLSDVQTSMTRWMVKRSGSIVDDSFEAMAHCEQEPEKTSCVCIPSGSSKPPWAEEDADSYPKPEDRSLRCGHVQGYEVEPDHSLCGH